jgi:alpha-ribazole phosphatase
MRLYLIRHPQPVVAAGVCYGSSDIAVTPQERERVANELAASSGLSALLPRGLPVYSSPLRRCAGLAQQLFVRLQGASLSFDPRLEEMHFGAWELRAWDDIAHDEVDAWAQDVVAYRPGGGECVMDMAQRVDAFYQEAQAAGGDRIVVCHAGTIRLLFACRQGGSSLAIAQRAGQVQLKIDYGQVVTLDG